MKKLLAIALAAVMTLSLAACGSSEGSDAESKLVVGTLEMNGNFVEGTTNNSYDKDIRDLIHGYSPSVVDSDGVLQWHEQVLDGVPAVKENADGTKTFTVKIKNDLKWNDGEAITAKDYVFAYMLRANAIWVKLGGSDSTGEAFVGYEDYYGGKTETFKGVKLLDDYSFEVTVRKDKLPYYWEKAFVGVLPMPVHHIAKDIKLTSDENGTTVDAEQIKDAATFVMDTYMTNPTVTCGPYKFISYKNKQVQLERNDNFIGDYRGEKPKIKSILVKTLNADKDVDTLIAGEVDIVAGVVEGEKIEKAKADENITVSNYPRNGYGNMPIATYFGATQEVEVRHALAYLVDTNKIAQSAMGAYGYPCFSDYGAAQKVYIDNKDWANKNLETYAYSIDKANEELDKSSYRFEKDGTTPFDAKKASANYLRYNDKGEALVIKHCGSENNPITDNIKVQLTENSLKVGMKYEVTIKDFASLLDAYYGKQKADEKFNVYNMATGYSEVPDPEADNHSKYSEMPSYNPTGIADKELDGYIEEIKAATNEKEYAEAWKKYQVRWNYLLPSIPTYTNDYYDFANKKVDGFKTTPFRNWANEICLYSIK